MPNEKTYTLLAYGEEHKIILRKGNYNNNGTLAIDMIKVFDDGHEEPWSMLTVNIQDSNDYANAVDTAFVDVNNLGSSIISWLGHNNIGEPTGMFGFSGFCCYPLFKFNKKTLEGMVELR